MVANVVFALVAVFGFLACVIILMYTRPESETKKE